MNFLGEHCTCYHISETLYIHIYMYIDAPVDAFNLFIFGTVLIKSQLPNGKCCQNEASNPGDCDLNFANIIFFNANRQVLGSSEALLLPKF